MNNRISKFHVAAMALLFIIFHHLPASYAQTAPAGSVASVKTRGGTVTYIVIPHDGYNIEVYSKEAGEPADFAGVVRLCTGAKQEVVFAMNGGKCDKNLKPLGLLIKGLTKQKDFVWPDAAVAGPVGPGGVFAIDRGNMPSITAGKSFKAANDLATYRLAIQSGPILISKSMMNPIITRSAGRQNGNGVGVKANGDVVFAISDDKMTLREFALFFQDMNCRDAMLLDNGTASQWYTPTRQAKPGKAGEILVVTRK